MSAGGEKMELAISFDQAQALANAKALTQALRDQKEAFDALGRQSDNAKEQIDEAGDGSATTAAKVAELGEAAAVAAPEIKEAGDAAAQMAQKTETAAPAVTKAADALGNVGNKAEEASTKVKFINEATHDTVSLMDKATASLSGFAAGYMTLQTAIQIMHQLDEETKNAIASRAELTGEKLDVDKTLLPLMLNLGLNPDSAGQQKTRDLAFSFQKKTGSDLMQTREILSAANANLFDVSGGEGTSGFDIASEVGKFAGRTGTDSEVAGQLLKLAQIQGVKSPEMMDKLIAQLEAGFEKTSINDPSGFYESALRSIAGRIMQGVPIDQAIGQVAAAAVGEVHQRTIHTKVERLSVMASGSNAQRQTALGEYAIKQSLLKESDVDALQGQMSPKDAQRHADTMAKIKEDEDRANAEADEKLRDADDLDAKRITQMADEKMAISHLKKPDERKIRTDTMEQRSHDMIKHAAELRKQAADQRKEAADDTKRAKESQGNEDEKTRDLALAQLYSQLPLAQQEQMIYDITAGKSPQEQRQILSQLASGEEVQMLISELGEGPRRARDEAMKNIQRSSAQNAQQKNTAALSNTVVEANRVAVAVQQQDVGAVAPGGEFAANLGTLADADVKHLRSQGKGQGDWLEWWRYSPHLTPEQRYEHGWSDEGLKAQRMLMLLRLQVYEFWTKMSPEAQAAHPEIRNFLVDHADEEQSVETNTGLPFRGSSALQKVTDLATKFGALRKTVQQEAATKGQNVPSTSNSLTPPAHVGPVSSASGDTHYHNYEGPRYYSSVGSQHFYSVPDGYLPSLLDGITG